MMKYFLALFLAAAIAFAPEAVAQNGTKGKTPEVEKKAGRKQLKMKAVKECIDHDSLRIVINRICPCNTAPRVSTDGYTLNIRGGKLSTVLPYIGNSKTPQLGDMDLSIKAEEQDIVLQKESDAKSSSTYYLFCFTNENLNSRCECAFQIYDDGTANIKISPAGKDPIAFQGYLYIKTR